MWRICNRRYIETSFSGEGGLRTPGRWHPKGYRIVYTSQSQALATLEVWVHVEPKNPLPHYVSVFADIPDDLPLHVIDEQALPPGWAGLPLCEPLQQWGTEWLESRRSAVARVPSAIIPGEFNYLLNPLHPGFQHIRTGPPIPFQFDPRMWKGVGKPD